MSAALPKSRTAPKKLCALIPLGSEQWFCHNLHLSFPLPILIDSVHAVHRRGAGFPWEL